MAVIYSSIITQLAEDAKLSSLFHLFFFFKEFQQVTKTNCGMKSAKEQRIITYLSAQTFVPQLTCLSVSITTLDASIQKCVFEAWLGVVKADMSGGSGLFCSSSSANLMLISLIFHLEIQ